MNTTHWWDGPLVAFDTETTGPDPDTARIVTAHLSLVTPGADPESYDWLLDPGVDIPAGATAVHGVTTQQAQDGGIPAAQGIADILGVLRYLTADGAPVVAFNACYDFTVLDREARRHGLPPFVPAAVVDPYVLDKKLDTYRKGSRKLTDVANHYGVGFDGAHEASADALAAAAIVRAMGARAPFPPVAQLHAAQIVWRAEQCASLEDYFRRTKDPAAVVARDWPVLPLVGEVAA